MSLGLSLSLSAPRRLGQGGVYYAPPSAGTDAAAAIATLFATNDHVRLGAGVYWSDNRFTVPAGKTLEGTGGAILRLRTTSVAEAAMRVFSGGRLFNLEVDANIPNRDLAGYTEFSHGVIVEDDSNVRVRRVNVRNAGETSSYHEDYASGLLVRRSAAATANVTDVWLEDCTVSDEAYVLPFGMRIECDFIGFARGEQGFELLNSGIRGGTINGTTKNAIEISGPDTHEIDVQDVVANDIGGQGGIEADYGAYDIRFTRNIIDGAGEGGVMVKSMAAFSARTSDQGDGKLKRCERVVFADNELRNATTTGSLFLTAANDVCSIDTQWVRHKTRNLSRGAGASAFQIIGHEVTASLAAVTGASFTDPDMEDLDVAVKIYGSFTNADLTYSGGSMTAREYGYWKADTSTVNGVVFNDGIELSAARPLNCNGNEGAGDVTVDGATLTGSALMLPTTAANAVITNTAMHMPQAAIDELLATNAALSGGGNTFVVTDAADALLARMFPAPSVARASAIRTLIGDLEDAGVWAKTRVFYIVGAENEDIASLNWTTGRFRLTKSGTLVFAANVGYTPDGTSGRLSSNFNPTTAPNPLFTQDDAHFWVWPTTNLDNAGANSNDFGAGNARWFRRLAGTGGVTHNAATSETTAAGTYPGLLMSARSGGLGADAVAYKNGALLATGTQASTTLVSAIFHLGAINTTGSTYIFGANQVFGGGVGSALTAGEVADHYAAINAYKATL